MRLTNHDDFMIFSALAAINDKQNPQSKKKVSILFVDPARANDIRTEETIDAKTSMGPTYNTYLQRQHVYIALGNDFALDTKTTIIVFPSHSHQI